MGEERIGHVSLNLEVSQGGAICKIRAPPLFMAAQRERVGDISDGGHKALKLGRGSHQGDTFARGEAG